MTHDELLRHYESNTLDKHHESLPFHNTESASAVYTLLSLYDVGMLLSSAEQRHSLSGVAHKKHLEEGISQALDWLSIGSVDLCPHLTTTPLDITVASEYLQHACDYSCLQDLHILYGHKVVTAKVDSIERSVTFSYKQGDITGSVGYIEAFKKFDLHLKSLAGGKSHQQLLSQISSVPWTKVNGRIEIHSLDTLKSPDVKELFRTLLPTEPHYHDPQTDLKGFSLHDFTTFVQSVKMWSLVAELLFLTNVFNPKMGDMPSLIPTQVVKKKDFLRIVSSLSGLSNDKINDMVGRLTFGNEIPKKPDVYLQPFFANHDTIAWSVMILDACRPIRNLIRLMSRIRSSADYAATINGDAEPKFLDEISRFFLGMNRNLLIERRKPVSHGAARGEVDLLIAERAYPDQILVIEAKAMLPVDEVNETLTATNVMKDGQRQVSKVIEILSSLTEGVWKATFPNIPWRERKTFFPVVISLEAEPIGEFDHSSIPGASFETIKARIKRKNCESVKKIFTFCRDRRWLEQYSHFKNGHISVMVGDVTYKLPIQYVRSAGQI